MRVKFLKQYLVFMPGQVVNLGAGVATHLVHRRFCVETTDASVAAVEPRIEMAAERIGRKPGRPKGSRDLKQRKMRRA